MGPSGLCKVGAVIGNSTSRNSATVFSRVKDK